MERPSEASRFVDGLYLYIKREAEMKAFGQSCCPRVYEVMDRGPQNEWVFTLRPHML